MSVHVATNDLQTLRRAALELCTPARRVVYGDLVRLAVARVAHELRIDPATVERALDESMRRATAIAGGPVVDVDEAPRGDELDGMPLLRDRQIAPATSSTPATTPAKASRRKPASSSSRRGRARR